MLRLTQQFSLKEDVLLRYQLNKDGSVSLDEEGKSDSGIKHGPDPPESIALVGHERGGIVLITRATTDEIDGRCRTYIDLYDIKKKKLITIYRHSEQVTILGCTVNEDRTLLVFTTKKQTQSNLSGQEDLYESFIGELHPQGELYSIGIRTREPQKVKFLYSDQESQTQSKKSLAYILFIVNEQHITLYQINFKLRPEGGVKMNALPSKKEEIAKNFLWCEWNTKSGHLYVISVRPAKKESQVAEYVLRCISFPDKKPSMFGDKDEKGTQTIFEVPIQIRLPNTQFDPLYLYSFNIHEHVTRGSSHMHMVQMRGNAFCLCQQHKVNPNANAIDISIFILHSRTKVDFSIPINNTVTNTRVFFDSLGDLLLVYIPGYYLQLLDCGQDHGPCPSLTLTGPEMVPHLPGAGGDKELIVTPFDILPKADVSSPDLRGHALFDCNNKIVYEFTFDREGIWKLFDQDTPDTHVQALHLAIIHVQDSELVSKILMHVCTHSPQNVSSALLSEYLVGSSYLELSKRLRTVTETKLEKVVQITTIESYPDYLQFHGRTPARSTKVTMIPGTKLKDDEKRFPLGSPSPARPFSSPSGGTASPRDNNSVRYFLKDLLGLEDESEKEEDFVSALESHMINTFPKEKQNCQWAAKEYIKIQAEQVKKLFEYIQKTSEARDEAMSFQIWENFYCCLEEFSFPFPPGFHPEFIRLGYKCLPRRVFMQYVHREVFVVDEEFVADIAKAFLDIPDKTPDDFDFLYQLALKLPSQTKAFQILKSIPECANFLMQYSIAGIKQKTLSGSTIDMEVTDESPFIPLAVFLHLIKRDETIDFPWIKENAERLLGEQLNISFDTSFPPSSSSSSISSLRKEDSGMKIPSKRVSTTFKTSLSESSESDDSQLDLRRRNLERFMKLEAEEKRNEERKLEDSEQTEDNKSEDSEKKSDELDREQLLEEQIQYSLEHSGDKLHRQP